MLKHRFSLSRLFAIFLKELIQMRRDRLTFAMMMGIPVMQLVLFGFAINTDPKHMPTVAVMQEDGLYPRALLAALDNSAYFRIIARVRTEAQAEEALASGQATFVINIPTHFDRDLVRGERPRLLVEADASDPVAAGNALNALPEIVRRAFDRDLEGELAYLKAGNGPVDVVIHRRYNPEGITQFNIIPGLLGVVLTLSMVLMTALSLTRETERGTMENLLAMPVTPVEMMLGKVLPYIGLGAIQVAIVLLTARFGFGVPILGSLTGLSIAILVFIWAMLALGYTFSTIAKNQMQAMQMTFFFFLPSMFLSGFMFPFRGMPQWAQLVGEVFPLTHFLRIIRGIALKGSTLNDLFFDLAALTVFLVAVSAVALIRFRRTLD